MKTMMAMSISKRPLIGAVLLSITTLGAAGALAAADARDASGTHEVRVSYADLDLSRPEGVETLLARLRGAAWAACGGRAGRASRGMHEVQESRACFRRTLETALEQVDVPYAARRSDR